MASFTRTSRSSFGSFVIDCDGGTLTRDGARVHLPPRLWAMLSLLVRGEGRLITKEEILHTIWRDTFVSDSVVKVSMRELRKRLGDCASAPRFGSC